MRRAARTETTHRLRIRRTVATVHGAACRDDDPELVPPNRDRRAGMGPSGSAEAVFADRSTEEVLDQQRQSASG
jgi:hypothetical protein